MKKENHFMVDIEASGTNMEIDKIMEIAAVEIEYKYPFWYPTGKKFHRVLHHNGKPETPFQKQHQKELFKKCNEVDPSVNYDLVGKEFRRFIHEVEVERYYDVGDIEYGGGPRPYKSWEMPEVILPKFFMGWNASNFDIPFLHKTGILTPCYYVVIDNKEELRGDTHYRIYEQTGSLQLASDSTGLDRKTLEALANDLNPTNLQLPEGKLHDAMFDCYKQIMMQNGLIQVVRMGIKK